VLDGARSGRFSLLEDTVDSDERRSVGTKLQYHIIENLGLDKRRHPDTEIQGVGVELKGTIRDNWAIPKEGQCGVTLLVKVDVSRWRQQSYLMRTHRIWLRPGKNGDGKRGIAVQALADYALDLYGWRDLRPNPLAQLTTAQREVILGSAGQERRFEALFRTLPRVVIPRAVILTVGAGRDDPLRRVRAARARVRPHELALLCGIWVHQRTLAGELGLDLTGAAWVAIPWGDVLGRGDLTTAVLQEMSDDIRESG